MVDGLHRVLVQFSSLLNTEYATIAKIINEEDNARLK